MIIPDSIEPYLGWKALRISGGTLTSPQRDTVWPAGKRLEARCQSGRRLTFYALRPQDPDPDNVYVVYYCQPGVTMFANLPGFGYLNFGELPRGCNRWVGVPSIEEGHIVSIHCACGIYVVDDPMGCLSYFRPSSCVLAQVALWGKVRTASKGARGEFAYPVKIYADVMLEENVRQASQEYGIPFELLSTYLRGNLLVTVSAMQKGEPD